MSNSAIVLSMINMIGDSPGRKDKEVLMKGHLNDELFRAIMVQALDPMITFGIKDLSFLDSASDPGSIPGDFGGLTLDADTYEHGSFFGLLRQLADRRLTGGAAKSKIKQVYDAYDEASRELLIKILAKDLRVGAGANTVNRVRPGTLFSFDVMLAAKFDEKKIEYPIRVEPKYDGMRLLAIGNQDGFEFRTRSGKLVDTISDNVINTLKTMYEEGIDVWKPETLMVFDGELMGENFADTMSQGRKAGHKFENGKFYCFDAFPLEVFQQLRSKPNPSAPYEERHKELRQVYDSASLGETDGVILPPSYIVRTFEEISALYDNVRARGLEGLILKRMNGLYHPRRNVDWMKLKGQIEADVVVIGAEEGTGKNEGILGAIVVDFNGVEVNVGGGFSDEERRTIWNDHYNTNLVGRVAEVWFHEVTPDGSMRHPRFKWFRDDKDAIDIEDDAADGDAGKWG